MVCLSKGKGLFARLGRYAAVRGGLNNAGEQAANEEAKRLKREAVLC